MLPLHLSGQLGQGTVGRCRGIPELRTIKAADARQVTFTVKLVPAAEIESAVIEQVRGLLRSPEIIVRTWGAAWQCLDGLSEPDVREALHRLDPLWGELFPAEQTRVVQLLVEQVDIALDGTDIRMRAEGLTKVVADLSTIKPEARKAA
ncbi:MAG: hypothetical protein U1E67_11320 [Hyphomicrobiales bacterium]